jgi:hypothetical protein
MNYFTRLVLFVFFGLASTALLASDLEGFWKNADQPAWIEIRFEESSGSGTVRRNDTKPEAVGRLVFKDIAQDPENPDAWRGQVYAERFEEYKDAEISLPEPDRMQLKVKVGFMSRTVNWTRVAALPEE